MTSTISNFQNRPPAIGNWIRPCLAAVLSILACCGSAISAPASSDAAGLAFFENRIRPVLVEHCYSCHSATAKKVRGALKLDTKEDFLQGGTDGAIVVLGQPDQSRLIRAVRYEDPDFQMPPNKDGGKKLADSVIADLVQWVKMGAPYPETPADRKPVARKSWAFDPIKNPSPPTVNNNAWPATSIDPFILAKIEAQNRQPAPPADRRTLIRRATFDLTGLPPTPDEIDAFLADRSTNAFAKVVDRLLSSRQYGERWGRHWLDVVRYADTAGDTADYPVGLAWRYRNYVIDAFNADKPYDEFLREQIAGDILAEQGPRDRYAERVTATGFVAISRRFGFDSENYHHLTIQDTLDTLGQTVLGLSVGCARCHDHKFDPVSMQDYYALYGIFASTRYAFPGSEQKGKLRAMVPLVPPAESQPKWREYDQRVDKLTGIITRQKQPAPAAVFRSLHDPDGDFEIQKDAAGGSYGVIVPPWLYEGKISVTTAAQSPFKNFYPAGRFGANIVGGDQEYRLAQALYPRHTRDTCREVHVNLDFRIAPPADGAKGQHRFWIGAGATSPAVELLLSSEAVYIRANGQTERVAELKPREWHNVQLTLDLERRTFSGCVGRPESVITFSNKPFASGWSGAIDHVQLDSSARAGATLPVLEIDNFGAQPEPIPPVSTTRAAQNLATGEPDPAALESELQTLIKELTTLLIDGPCEMTYGVVEGTPQDAHLQMRGEPDRPGPEVARGFIKALGGGPLPSGTEGSGRLELAQWLTRPDNPLTARVMVNRIWAYHFGHGLVGTPNDFGVRGQPPTHPELLDHLATRFMQSGWSVKAMHQLIMLSATYQQESEVRASGQSRGRTEDRDQTSEVRDQSEKEPASASVTTESVTNRSGVRGSAKGDSQLRDYSSFERHRLSAEELRDAILFVSGELDPTPGGAHPFPSPVSSAYSQHVPFSAAYDHNQRSVYLMIQRIKRHPFLALFDGPDPNASTAERRTTTVPTQALFFLNSPFVHEKADKFASRLHSARPDGAQRVELAWRSTIGRAPTESERSEAAEFLSTYRSELIAAGQPNPEQAALAAYVRTLFGSNEFLHLD